MESQDSFRWRYKKGGFARADSYDRGGEMIP